MMAVVSDKRVKKGVLLVAESQFPSVLEMCEGIVDQGNLVCLQKTRTEHDKRNREHACQKQRCDCIKEWQLSPCK